MLVLWNIAGMQFPHGCFEAHSLAKMCSAERERRHSYSHAHAGARPQSTAALTASSGPGQPSGSRLPREKRLAELMSAAPERLGLNAKREERTQPVTGGALAELASRAATERTPAKVRFRDVTCPCKQQGYPQSNAMGTECRRFGVRPWGSACCHS